MMTHAIILVAAIAAGAPTSRAAAIPPCALPATEIYQRVSPAVVSISAMSVNPFDRNDRIARFAGSGVIIDAAGLILTNSHVVFGRHAITVTLDDGNSVPGRLVGADPVFDLAVVRIPPPREGVHPAAKLGSSEALQVGQQVFAIGNPLGLAQTMTRGIISAINRLMPSVPYSLIEPLIQTDAAINPGNSGGPLVNECGEVIGITTARLPAAQNIGFAVPAALAIDVVPKLVRDGRVIRPWLGVQGLLVEPALKDLFRVPLVDGFLIEMVEPGSPAQIATLRGGHLEIMVAGRELLLGGDIITAIDGAPVRAPEELVKALAGMKVGGKIRLEIFREGNTFEVTCDVPERPPLPTDDPSLSALAPVEKRADAGGLARMVI